MTRITFYPDGYRAVGHADYAEYGQDIVCAALSALFECAELGLERVAHVHFQLHTDEESGERDLRLTETNAAAEVILATLREGIQDLQQGYTRYVRVTVSERRQMK